MERFLEMDFTRTNCLRIDFLVSLGIWTLLTRNCYEWTYNSDEKQMKTHRYVLTVV